MSFPDRHSPLPSETGAGLPFGPCDDRLQVPDAHLRYLPNALPSAQGDEAFRTLRREITWQQHRIRIAGREVACPRLSAWYGDPIAVYRYSNLTLHPLPLTKTLARLRQRIEALCDAEFNCVLLNLYRDGNDSMGWHADDEPELGVRPTIASLSLGAARRFSLRHRQRSDQRPLRITLASGSLLIMAGRTQSHWQHQLPKTRKAVGERINLTFRQISS